MKAIERRIERLETEVAARCREKGDADFSHIDHRRYHQYLDASISRYLERLGMDSHVDGSVSVELTDFTDAEIEMFSAYTEHERRKQELSPRSAEEIDREISEMLSRYNDC